MRKVIDRSSLLAFPGVIVFLMLAAAALHASNDDWPSIAPEDLKMTSISEQPGAPAVILYRQEFYDDKNNSYFIYRRIKVLTEAGRNYADVELPYVRGAFKFTQISARTVQPDGTVINFEGKPLDKIVLKAHGIKERVKTFSLPNVQVGSILDIRYGWRYDDATSVWPPDWYVQGDLFQKIASFTYLPSENEGKISWASYLPKGSDPQVGKGNRIDLTLKNIPAMVEEPYMPPPDVLRWRVNFYYMYSSTVDEYWKEKGTAWISAVQSFSNQKKLIERTLPQIITPADTPEQKVRKIYAYITGLENRSYIPERQEKEEHTLKIAENQNVEDVLKQRSGDHDDLNLLFAAMVNAAGIPARLMLVPDRSITIFNSLLLSMQQFDAVVVIVQLDGKDVFLDPGTRFCPYGLLNWRYSGVQGLMQTVDQKTSIGISSLPTYQQAVVLRKAALTMVDDGSEEGTVTVQFTGYEAMNHRQRALDTDAAGRKKQLEDELKKWLPPGSDVALTKEPAWDETETPLLAEFKISGPLAVNAGKRRMLPLHIFQTNEQPAFSSPKRTHVIYFDFPIEAIDQVTINLPQGSSIESLPQNDLVRLDYALYETKQKMQQPNSIVLLRNSIMGGMVFPIEKYGEIKDFFSKVSSDDEQQILLKVTAHAEGN
jgi:hypothetical protein